MTEQSKDKLRPVYVSDGACCWRGFFHKWTELEGKAVAIVETKDGTINFVFSPQAIRFLDREGPEI